MQISAQDIVCAYGNVRFYDNHSIAYCLLGYLCAYYRYYHPVEFITSFLNNAANDDDIQNGTKLARLYGIQITSPKFGISKGEYACNVDERKIAKGLASIKYIGDKMAQNMFYLAHQKNYASFIDLLIDMNAKKVVDSRQLSILIHIDFFSDFGNQRELETIVNLFNMMKQGSAKKLHKSKISGSIIEDCVKRRSTGVAKNGDESAFYTVTDMEGLLRDIETKIMSLNIPDYGIITKVRNYNEAMGYSGFISNDQKDRSTLYVKDVFKLCRKKNKKHFGYSLITQSIGSGIETRWTVFNDVFNKCPIEAGDVIKCTGWSRDKGTYFTMKSYRKIYTDNDPMADLEDEMEE